jgi:hypothetical protein
MTVLDMLVRMVARVKFASQADPQVLEEVRAIAHEEGRQFQAVVEEALKDWVVKKRVGHPRPEVVAHLKATIERNRELYRKLAQ